jgi:uncharacterized protein (TIGR03382 family)
MLLLSSLCAVPGSLRAGKPEADKQVAILRVEGARTPAINKALSELVRKHFRTVSAREFRRTARQLDATSMRADDYARVARHLGIEGVLTGTLNPEGKNRYTLHLRLRSGGDGHITKKLAVPTRGHELSSGIRAKLEQSLRAAIGQLPPVSPRASSPPAAARITRRAPEPDKTEVIGSRRRAPRGRASTELDAGEDRRQKADDFADEDDDDSADLVVLGRKPAARPRRQRIARPGTGSPGTPAARADKPTPRPQQLQSGADLAELLDDNGRAIDNDIPDELRSGPPPGQVTKRGSCAGCSASAPPAPGAALPWVAMLVLLATRRRA